MLEGGIIGEIGIKSILGIGVNVLLWFAVFAGVEWSLWLAMVLVCGGCCGVCVVIGFVGVVVGVGVTVVAAAAPVFGVDVDDSTTAHLDLESVDVELDPLAYELSSIR